MRKQNFSVKRQAILETIRSTNCHPSAEWVYQQLKPQFPNLSLGTVYRNIAQFKEDGLIISVGIINGHERFDAMTVPHGHFICKKCNRVMDILEDHVAPKTIASVEDALGVEIENHELVFYGLCPDCRIVERD
ncbi:MAG: transcriptional repressor [Oscillospiraceae bacterium]|nr:transcriptional repressor [Oscillospiraceae bacterium]